MHHFYMAQSYLASFSRARASKEIDEAIRLEPKNPKFHLLKMRIFLEQDKSTEGLKEALAALESGSEYISDVLAMSDEFYLPEAQVIYRKVISMGNKEVLPYLGLGNIALHSGDLAEAGEMVYSSARLASGTPRRVAGMGTLDGGQSGAAERRRPGQERAAGSARVARKVQIQGRGLGDNPHRIRRCVLPARRVGEGRRRNMPKPCACGGGATICAFRSASPMPSWEK